MNNIKTATLLNKIILKQKSIIAFVIFAGLAMNLQAKEQERDVTYIDLGPEGFSKVTLPIPGGSDGDSKEGLTLVDFTLLPFVETGVQVYMTPEMMREDQNESTESPGIRLFHLSLVSIPFFKAAVAASKNGIENPVDNEQPHDLGLKSASDFDDRAEIFMDQPLFRLLNVLVYDLKPNDETGDVEPKNEAHLTRARFIDTPVLRVAEKESWPDFGYAYKYLKTPILTAIERTDLPEENTFQLLASELLAFWSFKDKQSGKYIRFLDTLHLAQVYSWKKKNQKEHQRILRAWLVAGYTSLEQTRQSEEKTIGSKEWELLSLPFSSLLYQQKQGGEASRFTLIGTSGVQSSITMNGRPTFALWHENQHSDNHSDKHFLRLPLLGPVWATWKDDGEKSRSFLPNIFSSHYRKHKKDRFEWFTNQD